MTKARILVVDDDRRVTAVISGMLERHSFEVFIAHDGQTGLKLAAEVKPHLVILEAMMPDMDGCRVARCLKRDPAHADVAVLILSAQEEVEGATTDGEFVRQVKDRVRGLESGALDFLTKPVNGKDLVKRVKALLWAGGVLV